MTDEIIFLASRNPTGSMYARSLFDDDAETSAMPLIACYNIYMLMYIHQKDIQLVENERQQQQQHVKK